MSRVENTYLTSDPNDRLIRAEARIKELEFKLRVALEGLEYIKSNTGLKEPNFGDFTPLQFASRLGLIDIKAEETLAKIGEKGETT